MTKNLNIRKNCISNLLLFLKLDSLLIYVPSLTTSPMARVVTSAPEKTPINQSLNQDLI